MATPSEPTDPALIGLGARLRTLRERAGLTLAEVSSQSEISASTLSRLESGQRRATLELLLPLARLYRVSLDELIALPTVGDPRITPRISQTEGRLTAVLTRAASPIQIVRYRVDRGPQPRGAHSSHQGFEWLTVLSGRVRLVLGEHEFLLAAGESAEFDTRTPHWFTAAPGERADFMVVLDSAGGQAHSRTAAGTP